MLARYILLFLGVFACSTSAIFIRESATDPFVLTAFRLVIASLLLSPVFVAELRRHRGAFTAAHLRRTRAPAVVLAFHLMLWTLGARITVVAQATLIVNLVPVALPFFLIPLARERVNRAEVVGTLLAIAGLALLSAKDVLRGGGSAGGDAVCFLSMLLFALYLALGRRNRDFPSIWLYVIPVYAQAAVLCTLVALFRIPTFAYRSPREWALMFAMGAIPTVCGHSLLNAAMRRIRGQIVSLCNVSQFVFAGVMGFLLFGERPRTLFYLACSVVVAGLVIVVLATPQEPQSPLRKPAQPQT
ncbi:MAG TPA: DMT family transporter [Opitutaceae bacterium]|jgi:drug/metabolite transporter (DMT)-like permease